MPSKRKKLKSNGIPFHQDFREPSKDDRLNALGTFPGAVFSQEARRKHLVDAGNRNTVHHSRPSLSAHDSNVGSVVVAAAAKDALQDLDRSHLYKPTPRSVTSYAIQRPNDELDWLAQIPEEGETFDDFVRFHVTRSGRLKHARHWGETIVLLPIIEDSPDWSGPHLDHLVGLTRAFFDRPVLVLPPAVLKVVGVKPNPNKVGAFASSKDSSFTLNWPKAVSSLSTSKITGRHDSTTGHSQLQVESLLNELSSFKKSSRSVPSDAFCVMGVSMVDLYDGPTDLFCAGMAFGGSAVAVFSFFRYHPHLRMSPMHWYDFGYAVEPGSYSYYEDGQTDKGHGRDSLSRDVPQNIDTEEYLRRCGKLLSHELCHLYGLDHCIFSRCLMNGTGHLVEDFAAPAHLCPVCLRKLQWRLGFRVRGRYSLLTDAFHTMGMTRESVWTRKQVDQIDKHAVKDDTNEDEKENMNNSTTVAELPDTKQLALRRSRRKRTVINLCSP